VSLATATTDVLGVFTAAGIRATDDARNINPPCVYVMPPAGSFRFDRGRASIDWTAYLVTGDAGARAATAALSDMVDKLAGALPITTFTRRALAVPGGGDPLPAYELSWESTVTIGDTTP
jgi:hypothetical protein